MTEWTDASTTSTAWAVRTQNTGSKVLYNDANIKYDLDYITYNGYYVTDNTDWAADSTVSTAWAE